MAWSWACVDPLLLVVSFPAWLGVISAFGVTEVGVEGPPIGSRSSITKSIGILPFKQLMYRWQKLSHSS